MARFPKVGEHNGQAIHMDDEGRFLALHGRRVIRRVKMGDIKKTLTGGLPTVAALVVDPHSAQRPRTVQIAQHDAKGEHRHGPWIDSEGERHGGYRSNVYRYDAATHARLDQIAANIATLEVEYRQTAEALPRLEKEDLPTPGAATNGAATNSAPESDDWIDEAHAAERADVPVGAGDRLFRGGAHAEEQPAEQEVYAFGSNGDPDAADPGLIDPTPVATRRRRGGASS